MFNETESVVFVERKETNAKNKHNDPRLQCRKIFKTMS